MGPARIFVRHQMSVWHVDIALLCHHYMFGGEAWQAYRVCVGVLLSFFVTSLSTAVAVDVVLWWYLKRCSCRADKDAPQVALSDLQTFVEQWFCSWPGESILV